MVFHKDPHLRVHQYERENNCRTLPSRNESALPNTKGGKSTFLIPGNEPMQQMHANHAQSHNFSHLFQLFTGFHQRHRVQFKQIYVKLIKTGQFWLKHRKDNLQIKSWGCPFICISRDAEYVIVHWASQTGGLKQHPPLYIYTSAQEEKQPWARTHTPLPSKQLQRQPSPLIKTPMTACLGMSCASNTEQIDVWM